MKICKRVVECVFVLMLLFSLLFSESALVMSGNVVKAQTTKSLSFSDLKGKTFYFSSGAGSWRTYFKMQSNGKFKGLYRDTAMGLSGKGYSATAYVCNFSGRFSSLKRKNKYTYSMRLNQIKYPKVDKKKIKNGLQYITTTPYGLEKGKNFYVYLPGIATKSLPKGFRDWIYKDYFKGGKMQCYGLYNITQQYGFSGT